MFTKKDLFLLVPTLAVVVVPNAFANIPSTAYMEDYVATEIGNLGALATKDVVTTSEIADSAVTSDKIKNATIRNDDIATNAAIAASKISGLAKVATSGSYNDLSNKPTLGALASKDAVTTSEITDGTIATVDIADSAITTDKIAADAVTTAKIKNLNVTAAKIADGAVTSAKIADGTIATVDIADSAVTSAKIADGTIEDDDIADGAAIAAKKISGLAKVATTGSYNDLSNKPSIPSAYTLPVATTAVLGGVKQGDNVTIASDGKISVHAPYTLPVATTTVLGGVKQGDNVTIASDGKISVHAPYTLPVATTTRLGGVKIGGNIAVTDDGTVSVKTGSPSELGVVKVGQIPSGSERSTTYATIWVE